MIRIFLFAVMMVAGTAGSAFSQDPVNKAIASQEQDVKVLYFHLTRRCATCLAVENVSQSYIEKIYGDRVIFEAYNLDNNDAKEIAKKYEIAGQALIIVKGDNKTDITAKAFMNALNKPEKLEELLSETVDPLLIIE